ncbi:A/G-specific adenine glycosylase [Pleionea mediterranea]|uniref:Adenine DNA glycosylase n=1 Tax=Pleionea mediterranea TaxID=523701 RepID=A0A316FD95_9GAMM|nr:A/G-specific adenine glycosylase [Pleionea mediterranea]PWK46858.1 A/G-specific DNA-adenine glycosylase [Pleionea mediterranea]
MDPKDFQRAVLNFYQQHGRKNLPWQQDKTHYRVWVSEIMLQQTQVATVIPYYKRFMTKFPTLEDLAKASQDDVLTLWTGLGYYSRARNLHKCAQVIVNEHNGRWPDTVVELEQLPGIGRSTAGAIHSLSTGKPAAILDGNVKRVLCRFYQIEGWPGQSKVHKELWQIAEKLSPEQRADEYNQAMMDLGATLCTRRNPDCEQCPLVSHCKAYQQGTQHQYPNSKPKANKPVRQAAFAIVQSQNKVLLEKRPSTGIWGGLWSLPQAESSQLLSDYLIQLSAAVVSTDDLPHQQALSPFRHTFSHFHLDIQPYLLVTKQSPQVMDESQLRWQDLAKLDQIGLPGPVLKLLKQLNGSTDH